MFSRCKEAGLILSISFLLLGPGIGSAQEGRTATLSIRRSRRCSTPNGRLTTLSAQAAKQEPKAQAALARCRAGG